MRLRALLPRFRTYRRPLVQLATVATLILGVGTATPIESVYDADKVPLDLASVTERPDARSAAQIARATGRRIEVTDQRTSTGQLFALPDGAFLREEALTPQRARRADGTWAPIDTTLVADPDGTLRPANTPIRTALSGGGTQPLMTFADEAGHELTLRWPTPLPEPTVAGNVATYPDVLPGVDLKVRTDADGPRMVLVVQDRAAAANPALSRLSLPIAAKGVRVSVGAANNLVATDEAGRKVFVTEPLLMWDATPGRGKLGGDAVLDWEPSVAGATADVGVRLAGDSLVLTPDRALLADPATRYPVRIDPAFHTVSQNFWLLITTEAPGSAYWNGGPRNGSTEGDVAVGRGMDQGEQFVIRSFAFFNSAFFARKRVINARLQFTMSHAWSWSCTEPDFPLDVWAVNGINDSTTWNNQNVWDRSIGSTTLTHGNDSPNAHCRANTDVSFDVTGRARDFAAAGTAQIDFGLRVRNESCVPRSGATHCPGWRRFLDTGTAVDGGTPIRLSVTFNDVPNVPGDLQIDGKPCNANTVPVGAANAYTVTATLSDPNGETVNGELQVRQGLSTVHSQLSGHVNSGARAAWQVAGTTLQHGQTYSVLAAATDNEPVQGPWTPGCTVTVDKTVPAAPAVASTDYPAGTTQSGSVGRTGQFRLTGGDADVVKYRFGLSDPPTLEVSPATPGAAVTVPITPNRDGPSTLHVQAVDAAGNASTTTRYGFSVKPGTGPVAHYKLDDGAGSVAADTPTPEHPGDLARPGTVVSGPVWRSDPFDARLGHERHLRFNRAGRVEVNQPIVDLTKAYTITAWARMSTAQVGNRAIVSINGDRIVAAHLSYDIARNRWRFGVTANPEATMAHSAVAPAPPRLDVWTHLAGVYDPMTKKAHLYLDGALAGSVDVPSVWNAGQLAIGQMRWPDANGVGAFGDTWQGDIADVRVYDRAVQPHEFIGFVKRVEHWWGFHDGSLGTAADRSGNARTGAVSGAATVTTGFDGHGMSFDGLGSAVTTSGPAVRTDGSFTVSAWARMTRDDTWQVAASQDGTRISGFRLQYDSGLRRWAFSLPAQDTDAPTSFAVSKSDQPPKLGEWTHLTGVYDAANKRIQLWVNGQPQPSAAVAAHWHANGPFVVGRGRFQALPTNWFSGDLDEVLAHTGALNEHEIRVLADATRRIPAAQHLAGDFTGDGKADTVVIHGYPNKVIKLWALANSGGGNLETPVEVWNSQFAPWEMPTGWQHDGARWLAADFNGDGRSDIAVVLRDDQPVSGGWSLNSEVWVFSANGTGFNEPVKAWDSGSDGAWPLDALQVNAGDVTGDGRADLVLVRRDGLTAHRAYVLAATSTGLAAPVQWYASPADADPRRLVVQVGDVDNDGRDDLVYTRDENNSRTSISVGYSTGSQFAGPVLQWDSASSPYATRRVKPALADVTGDGRADVVHYYHNDGNVQLRVLRSNGRASFGAPATWLDTASCTGCVEATGDWAALRITAGDLDGDARTDLVGLRTTQDSKVIRIYTLRSTGTGYEMPMLRYTSGPDGL